MWKVEEYDNNVSERGIRVLDAEGRVVCCNEPYYPTAITAEHAATIVAAVTGRAELLATMRLVDVYLYATAPESNERQIVQRAIAAAEAQP